MDHGIPDFETDAQLHVHAYNMRCHNKTTTTTTWWHHVDRAKHIDLYGITTLMYLQAITNNHNMINDQAHTKLILISNHKWPKQFEQHSIYHAEPLWWLPVE